MIWISLYEKLYTTNIGFFEIDKISYKRESGLINF